MFPLAAYYTAHSQEDKEAYMDRFIDIKALGFNTIHLSLGVDELSKSMMQWAKTIELDVIVSPSSRDPRHTTYATWDMLFDVYGEYANFKYPYTADDAQRLTRSDTDPDGKRWGDIFIEDTATVRSLMRNDQEVLWSIGRGQDKNIVSEILPAYKYPDILAFQMYNWKWTGAKMKEWFYDYLIDRKTQMDQASNQPGMWSTVMTYQNPEFLGEKEYPSIDYLKMASWASLAAGASGLAFYSLWHKDKDDLLGQPQEYLDGYKGILSEIKGFEDYLQHDPKLVNLDDSGLLTVTFTKNPDDYLRVDIKLSHEDPQTLATVHKVVPMPIPTPDPEPIPDPGDPTPEPDPVEPEPTPTPDPVETELPVKLKLGPKTVEVTIKATLEIPEIEL